MCKTKSKFLFCKIALVPLLAGWTAVASAQQPATGGAAASRTGPISGYMDFHVNDAQHADPVLDFHRFVLLFTHSFSERVRFVSELELEHAVVSPETDGELELEQAYIDFLLSRSFNLRAGMVLAPVGVINERHEPPVFHGVERPLVETVIIPTTWFGAGAGAGVHGELRGGFPLPRLRDGDARRGAVQRRRGAARRPAGRAPRRTDATSPAPAGWSTSGRRASCSAPASGAAIRASRFHAWTPA